MTERYLTRVGQKFHFQIAVPAPLREKVEGRRKVIKVSLGTGDRRIAAQLARPYIDFWLAEFDRLRGRPTPALPDYAVKLPDRGYSIVRTATSEEVEAGLSVGSHDEHGEPVDVISDAENLPRWAKFAPEIEALEKRKAEAVVSHHRRQLVALGVPAAALDAALTQISAQAEREAEETLKLTREITGAPAPTPSSLTLKAATEKWKAESKPIRRTILDADLAVRRFVEMFGDMPISDITKNHIRDYAEAIKQIPSVLNGDDRKLPINDLIEKFRGQDVSRVESITSKKRLDLIRTILNNTINLGYIDTSPVDSIKITHREKKEGREQFSTSDLNNIFSSFKGNESEMRLISLVGLCTGCRVSEILQLTADDILIENGIQYISINKNDGKSIKTLESIRNVPIHQMLVDAGFIDYVNSKTGPIFKQSQQTFSTTFRRYLNRIGITKPTKVFHSFRYTFKTLCRDAGIAEEVHDALTGHAPARSVGRSYGAKPCLKVLSEAVNRLTFQIKLS